MKLKTYAWTYNTGGRNTSKYHDRHAYAGDCVVRAVSLALNENYDYVWSELAAEEDGSADDGVGFDTYESFLTERGWLTLEDTYTICVSNARLHNHGMPKTPVIVLLPNHLHYWNGSRGVDIYSPADKSYTPDDDLIMDIYYPKDRYKLIHQWTDNIGKRIIS